MRVQLTGLPTVSLTELGFPVTNQADDQVEADPDILAQMVADVGLSPTQRTACARALIRVMKKKPVKEHSVQPAVPARIAYQQLPKFNVCMSCLTHRSGCGCLPAPPQSCSAAGAEPAGIRTPTGASDNSYKY